MDYIGTERIRQLVTRTGQPQFLQGFEKWPRGPCIIGHGIALGDQSVA